jgi:hypothetical protein
MHGHDCCRIGNRYLTIFESERKEGKERVRREKEEEGWE